MKNHSMYSTSVSSHLTNHKANYFKVIKKSLVTIKAKKIKCLMFLALVVNWRIRIVCSVAIVIIGVWMIKFEFFPGFDL